MKIWGSTIAMMLTGCAGASAAPDSPHPVLESAVAEAPADLHDPNYWEAQCTKGLGNRCYLLGGNYERGGEAPWGFFPQDYAKAADAYRRGCAAGDVDSCGAGAALMIAGKPTRRPDEGLALAKATCDRGHATSCGLFGAVTVSRARTLSEYEQGLHSAEQGCASGGGEACAYLALVRTEKPSEAPRPAMAYGIRFLSPPEEMGQWCVTHEYRAENASDTVLCRAADGLVPFMGWFERGHLRTVMAARRLSGGADTWALALKDAVRSLSELYGAPSKLIVRGSACAQRSLPEQAACLETGQIQLQAFWYWESRAAVTAGVSWAPQLGPMLNVSTMHHLEGS